MTRIVAGTVGGRSLTVPPSGTRPTSERVREAMFSRLEHLGVVDGARVLDLFAGSGALGLEAASRGAVEVLLVDAARQAADIARRNAADLGLDRVVRVLAEPAERATARIAADGGPGDGFDLVLIDPPYDLDPGVLNRVLADLAVPGVLAPDAVVVLEQARRGAPFVWPDALVELSAKRYGDTVVHYAERRQAEEGPTET
ncbi:MULTISPECIES: 16S rRNA (guanine(966)-N(2))-methyltransferase RsmD [unclassified Isoptericola]|uniref:16S rRNA (guanine(966)-N(2))-methyltransferase RsmD n=1 Tax=unclassified Isoptericola TaxID=2623355 RepID=UPI0027137796|nr:MULTISPECIES: 16S rRNA (guanine(966)-N(2))-methyltransferase RsmD [unclassified Isoptericola]MDO8145448.1 16S rRNA (guanine(966)-N(2))-methyltransferase RsmD [Isoptericola sp. 178]MDO8149089.1 16S rRNA (guanine(966)-N(2))-methyltransferase RsmD [Isoptericola sp. b515]MDO8150971.1 16S rRNA (guanine(966)-N(2))-methyltransferase RsmD [Isoptericola sp. b408]